MSQETHAGSLQIIAGLAAPRNVGVTTRKAERKVAASKRDSHFMGALQGF